MIRSFHRIPFSIIVCISMVGVCTTYPLFTTLDELVAFTKTLPDSPKPSNTNLLYPNFSEQIEATCPTTITEKIGAYLGFSNYRLWNVHDCMALMKELTTQRKGLKYTKDHIVKLPNSKDSSYIVWGDIQGSLHSLARSLMHLRTEGIIDNNFKILQSDTYFIFNGNAVNRSPYSLATLTVLMRIIQQNPYHAFYIQGKHEQTSVWTNESLTDELRIRFGHANESEIPFFDVIVSFFETLPWAVYIQTKYGDKSPAFIRISNLGRDETTNIRESNYAHFLLQPVTQATPHSLEDKATEPSFIDIRVILESREYLDGRLNYLQTKGLKLISPDEGSSVWTPLSAATYVYQQLFNMYYDAFSILKTGSSIGKATIQLNTQDIRTLHGFTQTTYNFISGAVVENDRPRDLLPRTNMDKVTPDKGNEFVIGMITDFSNNTGTTGELLTEGSWTKITQINQEQNGIKNKRIRLVMLDNRAATHIAIEKINELLHDYKTNLLLTPYDTASIEAALPFIKSQKLLTLFARNGSQKLRESSLKYSINYRTSYYNEAYALVSYAVDTMFLEKFALCYHEEFGGLSALQGARDALKKRNITQWAEIPYSAEITGLDTTSSKIQSSIHDAVVLLGSSTASIALVQKLGIPYAFNKYMFCISSLAHTFNLFSDRKGLGCYFSRVIPNPADTSLQITREYLDHMKKYAPEEVPTIDGFEGYLNICLLIDVIEKMTGEITTEKIIAAFEGMKNYNFKGLELTFDPTTRELSAHKHIWIDTGTPPWILTHK